MAHLGCSTAGIPCKTSCWLIPRASAKGTKAHWQNLDFQRQSQGWTFSMFFRRKWSTNGGFSISIEYGGGQMGMGRVLGNWRKGGPFVGKAFHFGRSTLRYAKSHILSMCFWIFQFMLWLTTQLNQNQFKYFINHNDILTALMTCRGRISKQTASWFLCLSHLWSSMSNICGSWSFQI